MVTAFEIVPMKQLREVETAKSLMTEAMRWSVMKWLREKRRVRQAADQANAVLDQLSKIVQQGWPEELRREYESLRRDGASPETIKRRIPRKQAPSSDIDWRALAQGIKVLDDEAYQARMDAEITFDSAEKKLSTHLAREGCAKAIRSWELKQNVIQRAERLSSVRKE